MAALQNLIAKIWGLLPMRLRRWSMRVAHVRFTVTAGAVVFNDENQVLLLKHRFRAGSGWGLPGGFLESGEQPIDALRRELREEIGLEVKNIEVFAVRSFKQPQQVEILFRCQANGGAITPRTLEVEKAEWVSWESLPDALPRDQRRLVEQAAKTE